MLNKEHRLSGEKIPVFTTGLLLLLALLLSACAPGMVPEPEASPTLPASPTPGEEPTREVTAFTPAPDVRATRPLPERVPERGLTPVTGEAPAALLEAVLADLAERLGLSSAEIEVIHDEQVVWSDGSLGCPQPGMMYTQAVVPGYRILLLAEGAEYDYRASERGTFFLCTSGGLQRPPTPEY